MKSNPIADIRRNTEGSITELLHAEKRREEDRARILDTLTSYDFDKSIETCYTRIFLDEKPNLPFPEILDDINKKNHISSTNLHSFSLYARKLLSLWYKNKLFVSRATSPEDIFILNSTIVNTFKEIITFLNEQKK